MVQVILKSNSKEDLSKIIALAKKLNVIIELDNANFGKTRSANLKKRILNFTAKRPSSLSDAAKWERQQRSDRELPFNKRS